jgi:DNA polymerase-3 subunit delta
MQITLKQLDTQLKKTLPPLVLISGTEPLLIQEAREKVIKQAQSSGFLEKILFYLDATFKIETLITATQNQSLFSDKKIIDIRNPGEKFDAAMTDFLQSFLSNPPDDHLIIISSGKLTPAQQKAAWCDSIKKNGLFITIWPIPTESVPQWIMERAKQLQCVISPDLANMITYFCEGNLLATHQVIEKLQLMYPNKTITREDLVAVLSDHARFSTFDLSDAIATRNAKKAIRILKRLQQTGEEPILVLWNLARFAREKNQLSSLQKATHIDEMIKGAQTGDVWQGLTELTVMLCGATV